MEIDFITAYIQETYAPDALILHGSRARGMARESSDWDFILLYREKPTTHNGRILYKNQNIELSVVTLPVEDIFATFSTKLRGAKLLLDTYGDGATLLADANAYYERGVHWSQQKIADHRLWFQGRIDGMKHYTNQPELFYKYYSDAYDRIYDYWYWILQHTHSEPIYVAVSDIKARDSEYATLLAVFANPDTSLSLKVAASEQIRDYLFGHPD